MSVANSVLNPSNRNDRARSSAGAHAPVTVNGPRSADEPEHVGEVDGERCGNQRGQLRPGRRAATPATRPPAARRRATGPSRRERCPAANRLDPSWRTTVTTRVAAGTRLTMPSLARLGRSPRHLLQAVRDRPEAESSTLAGWHRPRCGDVPARHHRGARPWQRSSECSSTTLRPPMETRRDAD